MDCDSDLVAINGLGGLEYVWDGLAKFLAPRRRLCVLDLPGHGDRPAAIDYHYDALVTDAISHIRSPRFALVGWSVGAAIAWLVAARNPSRVTHLVLVEPAAPHQSPFRVGPVPDPIHTFTFGSLDKAVETLSAVDSSATETDVRRSYKLNAAGRWEPRFDPKIYPALVEDARERGEALGLELANVGCPVLVVRGERSFITEKMALDVVGLAPDARLLTVAGAGHFLLKEKPNRLAEMIQGFLI
jgi:pimeloyl-ACP methyl ester carboxylesterase